jgi:hypothetical protein
MDFDLLGQLSQGALLYWSSIVLFFFAMPSTGTRFRAYTFQTAGETDHWGSNRRRREESNEPCPHRNARTRGRVRLDRGRRNRTLAIYRRAPDAGGRLMSVSLALLVTLLVLGVLIAIVLVTIALWRRVRRNVEKFGYASLFAYLRAIPRTDVERRDAVDMALVGVVLCVIGVVFPPLLLVGLFPLFYGGRKVGYLILGLGLLDDTDEVDA